MATPVCPVCASVNHQSFWHWEQEEKLMRDWATDTRLHFSICRDCSSVFQNPMMEAAQSTADNLFGDDWNIGGTEEPQAHEPMEWVRQFTGYGRESGKALEVYFKTKRFENFLQQQGWEYKAIKIDELVSDGSDGSEFVEFNIDFSGTNQLEDGEQFDLVLCFDAIQHSPKPIDVLSRLYTHTKSDGALFLETFNTFSAPRVRRTCLTRDDYCLFHLHSLVFALYKAGFSNSASELCGNIRMLCTKMEAIPEADPTALIPKGMWGLLSYRFQRNYYWTWATRYLDNYINQQQSQQDLLDKARQQLHQSPQELHLIRDICGAVLLFVEEVANLRSTTQRDWSHTMKRIFDVFKNDYPLYDILQLSPLHGVGTFPDVERFHLNEKMIYMTTPEYFEKYFSQQEAEVLCDTIIQAGQKVCGHLSSFL